MVGLEPVWSFLVHTNRLTSHDRALQEAVSTATLCPVCYTHTVITEPPAKTCPPLPIRPLPNPACGIVCPRQVGKNAEAIATVAIVPAISIPRPTTVTVGTVTATVPGRNPACPTTATVTVTRARNAPTPDLVCPLARLPDCACGEDARRPASTVVVVYTVSQTATVYVTETPLTCAPLPTSPPVEGRAEPSLSVPSACTAYETRRDKLMCLDGQREDVQAPQITAAPVAAAQQKGLPPLIYTRDCTVHIVDRSIPCPLRGV